MKKLLLTGVFAFATMFASAQLMVVTTYDDDQEESIDKITANMGIGYSINDKITIGLVRVTHSADDGHNHNHGDEDDSYDLFARYNFKDDLYLSLQDVNISFVSCIRR